MSLEFEIDVASHLLSVTGVRDSSVGEIREAVEAVVENPQFDQDMKILVDFRDFRWIPSTRELKEVAECISVLRRDFSPRTALVVSNDLLFGVARLFSWIAKTKGYSAKPFKELSEARAWLKLDA